MPITTLQRPDDDKDKLRDMPVRAPEEAITAAFLDDELPYSVPMPSVRDIIGPAPQRDSTARRRANLLTILGAAGAIAAGGQGTLGAIGQGLAFGGAGYRGEQEALFLDRQNQYDLRLEDMIAEREEEQEQREARKWEEFLYKRGQQDLIEEFKREKQADIAADKRQHQHNMTEIEARNAPGDPTFSDRTQRIRANAYRQSIANREGETSASVEQKIETHEAASEAARNLDIAKRYARILAEQGAPPDEIQRATQEAAQARATHEYYQNLLNPQPEITTQQAEAANAFLDEMGIAPQGQYPLIDAFQPGAAPTGSAQPSAGAGSGAITPAQEVGAAYRAGQITAEQANRLLDALGVQ